MRWLGHMDASWRAGVSAHGSSASEHRAAADGRSGEREATVDRERERRTARQSDCALIDRLFD